LDECCSGVLQAQRWHSFWLAFKCTKEYPYDTRAEFRRLNRGGCRICSPGFR
jgi:hypothetical protein